MTAVKLFKCIICDVVELTFFESVIESYMGEVAGRVYPSVKLSAFKASASKEIELTRNTRRKL